MCLQTQPQLTYVTVSRATLCNEPNPGSFDFRGISAPHLYRIW